MPTLLLILIALNLKTYRSFVKAEAQPTFSHQLSLNYNVADTARAICSPNTIGIQLDNGPTTTRIQRIFASRHHQNPSCVYYVLQENALLRFELPLKFRKCGVLTKRTNGTTEYSVSFVISYGKYELSEDDQTIMVKCIYPENAGSAFASVTHRSVLPLTHLNGAQMRSDELVSKSTELLRRKFAGKNSGITFASKNLLSIKQIALPSEEFALTSSDAAIPKCSYSLHLNSLSGPQADNADIGQKVFHKWKCNDDSFVLKVYECYVHDGGARRFTLIDEHGCSTDTTIMPQLIYAAHSSLVYAPSWVFKFSNATKMIFDCLMYICPRRDPACRASVPPRCNGLPKAAFRRKRMDRLRRPRSAALLNVQNTNSLLNGSGPSESLKSDRSNPGLTQKFAFFRDTVVGAENELSANSTESPPSTTNVPFPIPLDIEEIHFLPSVVPFDEAQNNVNRPNDGIIADGVLPEMGVLSFEDFPSEETEEINKIEKYSNNTSTLADRKDLGSIVDELIGSIASPTLIDNNFKKPTSPIGYPNKGLNATNKLVVGDTPITNEKHAKSVLTTGAIAEEQKCLNRRMEVESYGRRMRRTFIILVVTNAVTIVGLIIAIAALLRRRFVAQLRIYRR